MTNSYDHKVVSSIGIELFTNSGTPTDAAALVMESLVESSLMGHDSHGVMRIPEYL